MMTSSAWAVSTCPAEVTPGSLRCEYRGNPIGMDDRTPRLSWQLQSKERGQKQTAYRVLAASSPELLQRGQGDLWDTGRVESEQSILVRYAGKPLVARQQCFWQVKVWDAAGQASEWSPVAKWEIGLPDPADWQDANWIRLEKDSRNSPLTKRPIQIYTMKEPSLLESFPSPMFRTEFELKPGIVRARAYVCGLGYSELYVNGVRVGDAVLDPGQTTYDVRAFYVTHDITDQLKAGGRNAVGFMVGNGFFGQNHAHGYPADRLADGPPVVIAKIVVDYSDGTSQTIVTDGSWKAATGPILYDNVYGGETYDARLERPGWGRVGYDDSQWQHALVVKPVTARLQSQMIPPIRCTKTIGPTRVIECGNGRWIFDLGQNIAGWARIKLEAPADTTLTLKFAEVLAPDGKHLDHASTGIMYTGQDQTGVYVCKGGGVETWEPRFTYHGFRYVEVAGLPAEPAKDFLVGVHVHTDTPRRGAFHCSDEMLNRIYQTSLWTIEDNMHSVMEDCPHREKCAWLGDAHAVAETTIFNYDMAQLWTKFVDDIETVLGRGGETYFGQKATPGIPCDIAVGRRLGQEARPDWGSAYVLLPWYLQTYYGDTEVFTRHYGHLRRWIDYVKGLREDGIVVRGYGDWCPPVGNEKIECPVPLTSTAFYYGTLRIMADFARQLGKTADTEYFTNLATETKTAFNKKFFNAATGGYGSQTADATALRFDLPPDGQTESVAKSLAREVTVKHKGHAMVGIHGGRPLFTQLAEQGYDELAITALKQDQWPGHAYTINQGFTTWPEIANEVKAGERIFHSLNHPMHSGFAAWFHESVAGIRPGAPGFKQIHLKPHGFRQLEQAQAWHDSPYGRIESAWQCRHGAFEWAIRVPPNTTATAWLPAASADSASEGGKPLSRAAGVRILRQEGDRVVLALKSGNYQFKSDLTGQ